MLYRIYKEWESIEEGKEEVLTIMVETRYHATEEEANAYIDRVRQWMVSDWTNYPNPKFRLDLSEISVEIIGPFESWEDAGAFVDKLTEFDEGELTKAIS